MKLFSTIFSIALLLVCFGCKPPIFSPEEGIYCEDIEVTITAPNDYDATYYTTDGSKPTTSSLQYTEPISVSGDGTEVTIKAYNVLWPLYSVVVSKTYIIDYNHSCGDVDNDEDGYFEGDDCDDDDPDVYPGATETCGDGVDQDCSGADLPCDDVDNDEDGYFEDDDCDDDDPDVYPGATEICDNKDNDCDGNVDEELICSERKFVFVTEGTWMGGDLNGLTGADEKCQAEADSADLPGTYKAWLSDSSDSPDTRFNMTGGPYVLAGNDTNVADDWNDLTDEILDHAIDTNANGEAENFDRVWTNTRPNGTIYNTDYTCQDWTSNFSGSKCGNSAKYGNSAAVDKRWTREGYTSCSNYLRLYCFQQ